MYDAMLSTTKFASIYFVLLLTFGTHILINLFIAIMVDGFASDPEALERFRKAIERTRAIMDRLAPPVAQNDPETSTNKVAVTEAALATTDQADDPQGAAHVKR